MVSRFLENGPVALYELLWACNQCILVVAMGLLLENALLVRASLLIVSLDQLLWYVDLIGYLLIRKFPVGVAKYIIWPETSCIRLLTTFHHLWFLPAGFYFTSGKPYGWNAYLLSLLMALLLPLIGRISAPK